MPPNSPPEANFLNITPGNPITSNNLYINWTFSDEDGDSESGSEYYWYRDGVHKNEYDGLQTLPSTATVRGDVWHVKVKPRDGKDFGILTSVSTNVTIGNTAPTIDNLVINPEEPVTASELSTSYDWSDLDELVLAYAISIHKSQGSEYPAVVIPLLPQHYIMLQRNLLYTAITRAKRLVVLVGSKRAIAIAIKNNKVQFRYTNLGPRLTK